MHTPNAVRLLVVLLAVAGCGGGGANGHTASLPAGVLLDEHGELAVNDRELPGGALADRFSVSVPAGAHLAVEVESTAFDPTLEVSAPGAQPQTNDDWNGDRTRSRVELVASAAGLMKVQVSGYGANSRGSYHLTVRTEGGGTGTPVVVPIPTPPHHEQATPAAIILTPGQHTEGELADGDARADDGSWVDTVHIVATAPSPVTIRITAPTTLRVLCVDGHGRAIAQTPEAGVFVVDGGQDVTLNLIGARAGATTRWAVATQQTAPVPVEVRPSGVNHGIPDPAPANPTAIQIGTPVQGNLAQGDTVLIGNELADAYAFDAPAAGPRMRVTLSAANGAFDPYVVVIGPGGQRLEDDDSGGNRNSLLQFDVPAPGHYVVYATSYSAGETGAYTLTVMPPRNAVPSNGQTQTIRGQLKHSDHRRVNGELEDTYVFNLTAGQTVTFDLSSTAFDTYLIVTDPTGLVQENDDRQSGNTDSLLDYDVMTTGPHKVTVSAYRSGMLGPYVLQVTGASGGRPLRGGMLAPIPAGHAGGGANMPSP